MWTLKNLLLFLCCLFLIFLWVPFTIYPYDEEFETYLKVYNKSYPDADIYTIRLQAFKQSLEAINELNSKRVSNASALYGLTQFSDLPEQDFITERLSLRLKNKQTITGDSKYEIKQKESSKNAVYKRTNDSSTSSNKFGVSADDNFINIGAENIPDILTIFQKYLNKPPNKTINVTLPRKIDWRERGVITDVNNQQSCGACWAFSAAEMIESMNAIRGNVLKKLSAQQLIDCSGNGNEGCNGGDVCSVLEWIDYENVGLLSEEEYPLHLKTEVCKMNQTDGSDGVRIKDVTCDTLVNNEEYILYKLATQGPVAVAINAILWKNYLQGVIHYHCSSDPKYLNHAVLIVGYNLSAPIPYYIAKNSWGKEFGQNGYIHIGIGKNICGIANEVAFVDV